MSDDAKEFFRRLHDTVVLLGGGSTIADLMDNPELITAEDVAELRRFNCRLVDATKDKLVHIHKIAIVSDAGKE